jgi:hypothetical protein
VSKPVPSVRIAYEKQRSYIYPLNIGTIIIKIAVDTTLAIIIGNKNIADIIGV